LEYNGNPEVRIIMSTLVIKNLPDELHARLREQAERNRRSVTKEAVTLIERGLASARVAPELPRPLKLKGGPVTERELESWIAQGRD
jgi:plasmid stability protein